MPTPSLTRLRLSRFQGRLLHLRVLDAPGLLSHPSVSTSIQPGINMPLREDFIETSRTYSRNPGANMLCRTSCWNAFLLPRRTMPKLAGIRRGGMWLCRATVQAYILTSGEHSNFFRWKKLSLTMPKGKRRASQTWWLWEEGN